MKIYFRFMLKKIATFVKIMLYWVILKGYFWTNYDPNFAIFYSTGQNFFAVNGQILN